MEPPRFISRYSAANVAAAPDGRLFSPSYERNAAPIAAALGTLLAGSTGTVLEIGCGPGQHAAAFAAALPHLRWQPTDPQDDHLASAGAWRAHAGLPNLLPPLRLDATADWAAMPGLAPLLPLAAVYAQNVLHIAPWAVAEGIVAGAARTLAPGGLLILYGPFREAGRHTGEGNERFDAALRAQNPDWGVRDLDDVAALACASGFGPPDVRVMPSNNRIASFALGAPTAP